MATHHKSLGDDRLAVHLTKRDGNVFVTLEDRGHGQRWGEAPLLALDIHDKMQRRMDIVEQLTVHEFSANENSASIFLGSDFHSVALGLNLKVIEGELSVSLYVPGVYENNPSLYRLFAINLFPGLMRADANGHLLLPITTGFRCNPADKPRLADRFLIYGEQERWELLPTLPFCAAAEPDGGLMALAVRGACDTECRVATDGLCNGETGFAFSLRRLWHDPVDFETREILYTPIPPTQKAEVFAARRLRRHITEDLGKPTLVQRMQEAPGVSQMLRSYIMKMFHASPRDSGLFTQIMKPQVGESNSPLNVWTTFAEGKECLGHLQRAGVDNVVVECVGWNPRGHDGLYPTRLPPEERLGGEEGFRDLVSYGRSLGYWMSVHDNYIDTYQASPDWNAEHVVHDCYGDPLVMGCWGGGINYRNWAIDLPDSRLSGQMRKVQSLGLSDFYYVDAMGNPLEVNYHPRHKGPRSQYARGIQRILETARGIFGTVASECGFLYAALSCDSMSQSGWGWDMKERQPRWTVSQFCDEQVPIWQMALHGLIAEEGHGHEWQDVMRKLLFGRLPRTEWCARPGLYPMLDEHLVQQIKAEYDLVLGQYGRLQTLALTDYQQEKDGTATSWFEDGTCIEVDFSTEDLRINGQHVEAPAAFAKD